MDFQRHKPRKEVQMANRLKMARVQSILSQGWSRRRIARELSVDRETVSRYVQLDQQRRLCAGAILAAFQNQPMRRFLIVTGKRRIKVVAESRGSFLILRRRAPPKQFSTMPIRTSVVYTSAG
jgi:hypothetical protein